LEAEWNQIESQHFNWPFGFDAILKRFKYEYQKNGRDQFIHRGVRCYVLFLWVAITLLLIGTDSSRTGKANKSLSL